jgi:hypothetical protein
MAALDFSLVARSALSKRENFAQREPGVIVVFVVVGLVALLVASLQIYKKITARRAAKA